MVRSAGTCRHLWVDNVKECMCQQQQQQRNIWVAVAWRDHMAGTCPVPRTPCPGPRSIPHPLGHSCVTAEPSPTHPPAVPR
jgi:hypothetical protein